MSGICGVVRLGGGTPRKEEVDPLIEPLQRRGPDGTRTWFGKRVCLGHALLATTPEALVEELPLHDQHSGCAITADARLDNREDLIRKLDLASQRRTLGDGELILRAYFKWGEDCPNHLLGDFAFAIWDERRKRLFCARDQIGMRQLAYCHLPGRVFVFATEPMAVLRHERVPRQLNRTRIGDYLDGLEGLDLSATFYSGVFRLPPAHSLVVDRRGLQLRKYWTLRTPPPLHLSSDAEYDEAFLDLFGTAVRSRLRSAGPVGAMLSGGMDSASVCAVGAEILADEGRGPLRTFSAVGPDPDTCVETRAIYSAARMQGIEPTFINHADLGELREDLITLTIQSADPFDRFLILERAIYLAAQRAGVKVVLDGIGGDTVLSTYDRVARLLRRGRIFTALREARGESQYWGPHWPLWKAFGTAAGRAWVPRHLRLARRHAMWWLKDRRIGQAGLISRAFADEIGLRERRRQLRARDSSFDRLDRTLRAEKIAHANLVIAREHYDRAASAVAVEPRDPFLDLRVVEFGLALPDHQLQSNGWPKPLLRAATAGKVPDPVRWRRGKEHLGWEFVKAIYGDPVIVNIPPARLNATIAPYIDLGGSSAKLLWSGRGEDCKQWIEAVCLFHWLDSAIAFSSEHLDSGGNRS